MPRTLAWVMASCFVVCLATVPIVRLTGPVPTDTGSTPRGLAIAPTGDNSHRGGPESIAASRVAERFEQTPLAFEPNGARADTDVKFLARGPGYAVFLAPTEAVLALHGHARTTGVLRLKLVGAKGTSRFYASDELPGKSNYLIGNMPATWRTQIPNYGKVADRGVYRGIDVVYYGNQHALEYDFVVAPGADPDVIRLSFQGADDLHVDQGDLVMTVAGGEVRMHQPVAYQESGGARRPVAAKYVIGSGDNVGFQIAEYDSGRPLIIDPTLAYSTYLGGSNIDGANAIAVAPDNTAFITGGTFSLDFPTAHPLQPNHSGPDDFDRDAFVAKISADGSTLLYSTYLGGKNQDVGNGIAVDTFGDAYVTGTTLSPDFPVTPGVFNPLCGGDGKCAHLITHLT
jgi:Beta-propeller repeat